MSAPPNVLPQNRKTFHAFQRGMGLWCDKTFPHSKDSNRLKHMLEEVTELAEAPADAMEMADIFLILVHHAHVHGVDLWDAMRQPDANIPLDSEIRRIEILREAVTALQIQPSDVLKMAEIGLRVEQHAQQYGVDLWEAAHAKYAEIRTRTWHPPDADGIVRHVKQVVGPTTQP